MKKPYKIKLTTYDGYRLVNGDRHVAGPFRRAESLFRLCNRLNAIALRKQKDEWTMALAQRQS